MSDPNRSSDEPPLHNETHRFFDLSIDLLTIVSKGKFVRLNPAWERILGHSIEGLLSTSPYDLIHPDDLARTAAIGAQIGDGDTLTNFENRYRHKDGTYRWLEWTARFYPGESLTYCVARDITERKKAEDAQRQSEQAMRALLDGVPDLAIMMRPDGTVLMLNQKQADILGKPVDEIVGRSIFEFIATEEMRQERRSWFEQAIELNKPRYRQIEPNGRHLETYTSPVYNDQGEIVAFVATSHDITHIKQTEETLYSLLDSMPNMAIMMRLDGTVLAVNQKQVEFIGKPIEEIIGRNAADLMADEVITGERITWVQQAVTSGTPRTFEYERDGEYGETTIIPVWNRQGEVYAVVVSTHDITHLKQTESALRKSEEQFRSVLEAAAEGILVTDSIGDIVLVNREIERQFGYSREELIGAPVEILLPEVLRKVHIEHRKGYTEHPDIRSMGAGRELMGRRKDGTEFPIEVSLSYTQSDELLIMAFIVDITERKQIEQERLAHEKLQAEMKKEREIIELRQRFMSMISHEFRTPLTAIASSCELLDHYFERLTEEQRRERVRGLNAHVHTMVGLLDDILMLNRIQAGMAEFKPEPLDVAQLSRRVLDTAAMIDQGRHELAFFADQIPEIVPADRRILEHILTNLLSNAIKYSPPGTKIDFRLSGKGEKITFVVRDEGYGIPEADQEHLFEPFSRARNVGEIQGTGLGLAIVKSNVELHGGSIRFHSAEGKGTTFWVDLPVTSSTLPL
jgi:PAS domain S-box-containing protein